MVLHQFIRIKNLIRKNHIIEKIIYKINLWPKN